MRLTVRGEPLGTALNNETLGLPSGYATGLVTITKMSEAPAICILYMPTPGHKTVEYWARTQDH
ncbi:MAG: hypothetical protein L0I05_09100 [Lactobacillus sp.]|nr:hypothetical protein [Lactobacillus sp.]MDN6009277.1 hypothetical protein [Lactobacillus sp.]